MSMRVKRGHGRAAHMTRMALIKALEALDLIELLETKRVHHHGEWHYDYIIGLERKRLILRSRELEPFVAGVAWGYYMATGKRVPGTDDVYRPDAPIRPGQVAANKARKLAREQAEKEQGHP